MTVPAMPHLSPGEQRSPHAALRGRDFLSVDDLSSTEILGIFRLAADMKRNRAAYRKTLEGVIMALIFEKPSLRTRTTFDVGIKELGGDSIYLSPAEINLGKRESVYDVAKNLERMVQAIMIRTFAHEVCTGLAHHASIPVINGLTDLEHPCQAMADFFTMTEYLGNLPQKKLVYMGDGNNVAHSLMLAAAKLGARLTVCTPERYGPSEAVVRRAQAIASGTGGSIGLTADPAAAASGADMIYTDVWASMGQEAEAAERRKVMMPYQVNGDLFRRANPAAIFMHCLPAHRGEEVTDEVIDAERSVVFPQAENRLHVQKAIMFELLKD
ncbi:MAG: ornithine carbamoyltransferase [Bacteroidota bacterium]